jgi:hypothetical protein
MHTKSKLSIDLFKMPLKGHGNEADFLGFFAEIGSA